MMYRRSQRERHLKMLDIHTTERTYVHLLMHFHLKDFSEVLCLSRWIGTALFHARQS